MTSRPSFRRLNFPQRPLGILLACDSRRQLLLEDRKGHRRNQLLDAVRDVLEIARHGSTDAACNRRGVQRKLGIIVIDMHDAPLQRRHGQTPGRAPSIDRCEEDIRDTVATGETVTTKSGSYTDCVKVYDWTPLEKNAREHKYHCPEVGALVLTEDLETGSRSELVSVVQP